MARKIIYNLIFIIIICLGVLGVITGIPMIIMLVGRIIDASSFLVKICLTFYISAAATVFIFYYFFTFNGNFEFISRRNKIKKSKLLDFLYINLFVSSEFLLVLSVINQWAPFLLSESPIFIFLLLFTAFWFTGNATVHMIKYNMVNIFKKDIQNAFDKRKKELHSVQDESQSM